MFLSLLPLQILALKSKDYEKVASKWNEAAPPIEGAWYTNKLVLSLGGLCLNMLGIDLSCS